MLTPNGQLSCKLQEKLTQAQYPIRPTLYYLSIDGGDGMKRYLTRNMTRRRFKKVSGKLRKAVGILIEKDMVIQVAAEGLTLI